MKRLRRGERSLTARLAVLFAVVSTIVLTAAGIYLDRQLAAEFAHHDDVELRGKIDLVGHMVAELGLTRLLDDESHRLADLVAGHPRLGIAFFGADGRLLRTAGDLATAGRVDQLVAKAIVAPEFDRMVTVDAEGAQRLGLARIVASAGSSGGIVALVLDTSEQQAMREAFRRSLALTIAVSAVVAALGGLSVALLGMRPLQDMARTVQSISASRLSERISIDRIPREIRPLAASFNEMLDRLEDAFVRLADFSSDLAHELRTPVNTLIGQTQVALGRPRSPDEYREMLNSNLEEFERLSRMTDEMLFLARADNRQQALNKSRFQLRAELAAVIDFYEALLDENGLRVALSGDASVLADRSLVQRAASNLLSNAIRYSPAGETIRIDIETLDAQEVALSITNVGAGIETGHLDRIFDRFYRTDSARRNSGEGSGLGLAIVKSIAELHGGRVEATSTPGKETRFRFVFPGGGESI